jgi:cell division septal protein FtsQ
VLAALASAALVAALVALLNGPWLRVERLTHAGERYTAAASIDAILAEYRGAPLLSVDTGALAADLGTLPAVASASVVTAIPGELRVTLVEKEPAITWLTPAVRLVATADGSVIGELAREVELPAELAALPAVDDQRPASRRLATGDTLPPYELRAALRLLALDPTLLGSASTGLSLRIDAEYGFIAISDEPAWEAAFGYFGLDPREDAATADARLEGQIAAVRTLFATRPEASVSWVDARNPGRVYWTP